MQSASMPHVTVHGAVLSTISGLCGAWQMSVTASMGRKVISYSRAATKAKMLSHLLDQIQVQMHTVQ